MTSPRRFLHRERVRYNEVDRMGVIYHPIFLRYFENARIELLRELGFPHGQLEDSGTWFVVADASIRYLANVGYDAEIGVETAVSRVGRASVDFDLRVLDAQRVLATGRVGLACTDGRGKVLKMPQKLFLALKECEGKVEN